MLKITNNTQKELPVYVMRKMTVLKPGVSVEAEQITRRELTHALGKGATLEGSVKIVIYKNFRDLIDDGTATFGGEEPAVEEIVDAGEDKNDDTGEAGTKETEAGEETKTEGTGEAGGEKTEGSGEEDTKETEVDGSEGTGEAGGEKAEEKTEEVSVARLLGLSEEDLQLSPEDLDKRIDGRFKAMELRDLLAEAGMDNTGTKKEIIERLVPLALGV